MRPSGAVRLHSMTQKRWLLALAILVLLAAAGWWRFGRGPEVSAVAPKRGTAVEIVYATGGVEPVRWAKVASLIRDRIVEICDCEGKAVKKSDVLARLDDSEVKAQLQDLKAREAFLVREMSRVSELITRGAATTQAYEKRVNGPGASASADQCAGAEDQRLHHRCADGWRGAAPRRRDGRNRRSRADPLPRRRAQAAAGGGRGQRRGHPARQGRADRAVPHRRLSGPAAGRQSERDHAHGRRRRQDLPRQDAAAGRYAAQAGHERGSQYRHPRKAERAADPGRRAARQCGVRARRFDRAQARS